MQKSEMKNAEIKAIKEKIDLADVQVQADPCKDKYLGIFDCLRDCAYQTPRGSTAY